MDVGLNVQESLMLGINVCRSSADVTSTAELRRHISEGTSLDRPWLAVAGTDTVPQSEWPRFGFVANNGIPDTDDSDDNEIPDSD